MPAAKVTSDCIVLVTPIRIRAGWEVIAAKWYGPVPLPVYGGECPVIIVLTYDRPSNSHKAYIGCGFGYTGRDTHPQKPLYGAGAPEPDGQLIFTAERGCRLPLKECRALWPEVETGGEKWAEF